jgi:site-specific DNA recombinase
VCVLEQEPLIRDAVEQAFVALEADRPRREADLSAVCQEVRQTQAALYKYLTAFENGSMPEAVCAPRVEELGVKLRGLEARRGELSTDVEDALYAPSDEELEILAAEVRQIIASGDRRQIKACSRRT